MTPIDQAQEEIRKMTASRQQAIESMVDSADFPHFLAHLLKQNRTPVTLEQALARIKALTMDRRRVMEHNGSEGL